MNFVWIVKKNDDDIELSYSIRSVLKYHPNANIFVIGDLPDWYGGEGLAVSSIGERYSDKWNKLMVACDMFEEFIQMDDDFFLLDKFTPIHYYYGKIKEKAMFCKSKATNRQELIWNSYELDKEAKNYMVHIPLPIYSPTVKDIDDFVSFRQYYCNIETRYLRKEHEDVKIMSKSEPIPNAKFFSTNDKMDKSFLKELYPTPSHCENDV
jgi:hypothetical protein